MLHELKNARQVPGEGFRRWFTDADMDLVVWYQDESLAEIIGFQLSYDKTTSQHALTWTSRGGFQLNQVDDGELVYANKMSPVLMPPAGFDGPHLLQRFAAAAEVLEFGIGNMVRDRIAEYDRRYRHSADAPATAHPHPSLLGRIMLDCLRDAFYGPALHGPTLMSSLESLSPEQAAWTVERGGKTVGAWQIALHAAYWKHFTTLRFHEHLGLGGLKPLHRFELEDWSATVPGQGGDWRDCLDGLRLEHEAMVAAVTVLVTRHPQSLGLVEAKSGMTWAQFVYGMAAHDVYHAAQLRNLGIPGLKDD
jgi:hypothetical protein